MSTVRRAAPGLQPLVLVFVCWSLTLLVAAWAVINLDGMGLVRKFMRREGISADVFGFFGLIWIATGMTAYAVGDILARIIKRINPPRTQTPISLDRAAQLTFLANFVLLGVTFLWIMVSALQMGGIGALIASAKFDNTATRDVLLGNKLFVGMRLFYAALPATACMAAALLTTGGLSAKGRRLMIATLVINTVALLILPLVLSQRLLLLQLLLSAYFGACMIKGRIFGLHWAAIGILLFLTLWVGREALTNPAVESSSFKIAMQKLAYYVVNDMFNAFAPLTQPIQHTNGGLLLEGVMFMTLSDGYFLRLLEPRFEALDPLIGGGEFPLFTAAYVDFGIKGGVICLAFIGFVLRRIYVRGTQHFGWAVVYAQIAAALMFSSHSVYFTHQNFYFSALLIALIVGKSTRYSRPGQTGRQSGRAYPLLMDPNRVRENRLRLRVRTRRSVLTGDAR